MPSSLFGDLGGGGGLVEDQRAFQLALELSMLSLGESLPSNTALASPLGFAPPPEDRAKKSQNMTECVPVPSSEHVAEIVGRQGCKIKALRAKTNTYIKTPVRGEEPVFVVTGRKEDVARAKREILSAAEHFSQIRASRKCGAAPPPPAGAPGHVTAQVRVPYRVVGLVVGPKGATIKRIQHTTHTYIVTPSREREPVFEVTGLPESVEAARKEIEAHIALRTGAAGAAGAGVPAQGDSEPLATLYRAGLASLLRPEQEAAFSSAGSCSSGGSSARLGDLLGIWSSTERDEGLGESPSFESPGGGTAGVWAWGPTRPSPAASPARACAVCGERGVAAALVPCGHNLFCLECAQRLAAGGAPCPACSAPAHQAIRIIS
ncbi:RNA-binding protein MEX3B [Helicoverpa armigera]|uniref:RNA-binding protein MEX3B n=1 Tax=Helicoverpa armigera TaxID=29058 RepID=UPI001F58DD9C|nr:RNA-binding protein MEX3B isoform X1 [Helicoverpa zea]XP_049702063.1 RNA-binding protein MEX3B [Helicoverpa armigera]